MWDLIVSVPDHCLSFYFTLFLGRLSPPKRFTSTKVHILSPVTDKYPT